MSTHTITPDMAGCWLDGQHGWHNNYRVIGIALACGWHPASPGDVHRAAELYQRNDPDATIRTGDGPDLMTYGQAAEWVTGQGGLADQATDYLQSQAPAGYVFAWDAGDLLLLPASTLDH